MYRLQLYHLQIHVHLKPLHVTLFRNKIFAEIMKLKWDLMGLEWALIPYDVRRGDIWIQRHRHKEKNYI